MTFLSSMSVFLLVLGGSPADQFFYALGRTESGLRMDAIGDNGRAVGIYQIHEIYVRDVNRILRKEAFSPADRLDPAKSRRMITIYLAHYASPRRLERTPSVWDLARIHNGGPNGHKKQSTIPYVIKFAEHFGK